MKFCPRKFTALLLSAALAASALAAPAGASFAMGEDLSKQDTVLSRDTVLSSNVFWSTSQSDLRRENVVTYTPNGLVTPIVTVGDTLGSRVTPEAAGRALEAQGCRVVAGINGDFYELSSGQPIGLVIQDGKFLSSDNGYYAAGFRSDGSAVFGKPGIAAMADLGYDGNGAPVSVRLAGVNKPRASTGGIYLYTYEFNEKHTTGTTEPGVDVVCTVEDGELTVGGQATLRVERILRDASATPIQPEQMVLSINNSGNPYFLEVLSGVAEGSAVTVTVTAGDPAWNDVDYALGALYSLLENGQVAAGLPSGAAPRTAIGQKADGSVVLYTIDGRQSGFSIGATLTQVAERMAELGCVTALGLDGGGSTAMTVTKPDAVVSAAVNRPSDGRLRAVSNNLFLVAPNEPSGELSHFYVAPEASAVLAGSRVKLAVSGVDTNYIPMTSRYELDADRGGEIEEGEDGAPVLLTPRRDAEVTVTASRGRAEGEAVVRVVETPDSIVLKNGRTAVNSLTLAPGGTLQATAQAMWNHLPLQADAGVFTWTMTGEAATVDETGLITAHAPGEASLTVSAGGRSVTVPVTVSRMALATVEDFEEGVPVLSPGSFGASLTAAFAPAEVRIGRGSARLDYTLDAGPAQAVLETPLTVPAAYNQLNLWVLGDGSGNTLSLRTDHNGEIASVPVCVLDFTGWKQAALALPAGSGGLSLAGFSVEGTEDGTISAGSLWLDQLTASFSGVVDDAAPEIAASVDENGVVTAKISDAVDGVPPLSAVAVVHNGADVTGNAAYSADGTLIYSLAFGADQPHELARVTITARDASGNLGRASVDVEARDMGHHFSDIQGHWAASYIDYLSLTGITGGFADGTFRPDQTISRQQFAAMLFRGLGLNAADYEAVALPYADADKIEGYALPAAKALYALGVMGGTERDGALYFNPTGALTRAQAAALFGRSMEKGFAQAEPAFTDREAIPAYAAEYVGTMAALGILGGYEDGSFRPNVNLTRGQMAKIFYMAF